MLTYTFKLDYTAVEFKLALFHEITVIIKLLDIMCIF